MLAQLTRNWWAVAVQGAALILFGLLTLFYPMTSVITLVYLFGIFAIVQGAFAIVSGFDRTRGAGHAGWLVAAGVVGVLAGIVAFVYPGVTLVALYSLIAAWAIVTGVLRIVQAVRMRQAAANTWLMGVSGVLNVIFGLVLYAKPGIGLLAVTLLIGIYAIAAGIAEVALALYLRDLHEHRVEIAHTGLGVSTSERTSERTTLR